MSRYTVIGLFACMVPIGAVFGQSIPVADTFSVHKAEEQQANAWSLVPEILSHIVPPDFPARTCDVTDYGASPDSSSTDDRPGILAALSDCANDGGGKVLFPPGDYLSEGPIHLRDSIQLHLEIGATLRFGTNPVDYTPLVLTRWEGTFAYNYSPLIYANGATNVAITGGGTIDGQTEDTWSRWKSDNDGKNQESEANKPRLRAMGAEGVPVEKRIFGNGYLDVDGDGINDGDAEAHYLRPSLVEFVNSQNILIEDVTLRGSPFWTVHPVLCENVTVRNLTIRHGTTNDDGIDPDGSRYVLIEGNDIHVDDDAIAIKAGRDADGRSYPGTAYVVIRNNLLRSTRGGAIAIGSEMSAGVEWIFIDDNIAHNTSGRGLYLKSNLDRGGFIRHVYVRNLDVLSAIQGFEITSDYKGHRGGDFPTDVHDIFLDRVRVWHAADVSMRLLGQEAAPVRRIYLRNVDFRGSDAPPMLRSAQEILSVDVTINRRTWHAPTYVAD